VIGYQVLAANTLASLSRAFRLAGHEAVVCDNAARALELARTQPFDLILSDVVMPRRDGLALLEDLKTAGVAAPVVMMSGQAHIEMAVKRHAPGRSGLSREAAFH
jgi:two-component system, NtrC family, nitrogen regulation response regulator NtrX